MKWFEEFIDNLAKILDKPPYLIFLFVGAIWVFVSVLSNRYIDKALVFLLYSVVGSIWRYAEKDIYRNVFTTKRQKAVVIFIYHLGNFVLLYELIKHLKIF